MTTLQEKTKQTPIETLPQAFFELISCMQDKNLKKFIFSKAKEHPLSTQFSELIVNQKMMVNFFGNMYMIKPTYSAVYAHDESKFSFSVERQNLKKK